MEPKHAPHRLGRWGEDAARDHLEAKGWRVLARNYRLGRREVDLVVERGGVVCFVEVKTRSGRGFGGPLAAITAAKRREIEAVAADFLRRHAPRAASVRFDAVAVHAPADGGPPRVRHVEDAWRPSSR